MATLRRRPDNGRYYIDYVDARGARQRELIRDNGEPVTEQARAEAIFQVWQMEDDGPVEPLEIDKADPRLRELRSYFESTYLKVRGARPKTYTGYHKHLDEFIHYCDRNHIGRVSQLNEERLQKWAVDLAKHHSAKTVKNHLSTVRSMLNAAFEARKIDSHPVRKWLMPRVDSKDRNTLTWDEVAGLVQKLRTEAPAWLRRAILYIVHTGQSPADVAGLKWPQVFLETGHIRRDRTKIRALRDFPLNPAALALLREVKADGVEGAHVFRDWKGEPLNANRLWQHWMRWNAAHGGCRTVTLLDLRHTFATLMANGDPENGIQPMPLQTLRVLMNHASILTTATYAHADRAEWALTAFSERVEGGGSGPAEAPRRAQSRALKPLKKVTTRDAEGTKGRKR